MPALATGPRPLPPAARAVAALLLLVLVTAITVLAPWRALAVPSPPTPAGPWRWPLPVLTREPEVTRGFDPPAGPYGPGHRGVDLAAAPGTPVLAAGTGVVGYAGDLADRGVVTVMHAGGLRTTYEPVRSAVRPGQHVTGGTVLGTLEAGHPGCPRAACLHWGLLRGHTYLDPLSLLRRSPVRLLPLAGPAPAAGPPPVLTGPAGRPTSGAAGGAAPAGDRDVAGSPRSATRPWTRPGVAAAIGLAVAGALALSRRRP